VVERVHRDATARSRVREYLQTHGPVEHSSGNATRLLRHAVAYEGSPVAFIQLLKAMDRDGEIERTIKGKRTFRIVGVASPTSAAIPTLSVQPAAVQLAGEIDYERLAKAIVNELAGRLVALPSTSYPASAGGAPTPAHLASEEHARLVAERDDYARRLEEARGKLDELLGSIESAARADRHPPAAASPLFRKPASSDS
jgi:hypothetical protein